MRKWISSSSWLLVASSSLSFSALRPEQWPLFTPSYFSPMKFPWRAATTTFPSAVLIKLASEKFRVEFARWTGIARFETLYTAPSRSPTPLVFFARGPGRRASHSSISASRKPISWYLNYARFRTHRSHSPVAWWGTERRERETKKARCNIASFLFLSPSHGLRSRV